MTSPKKLIKWMYKSHSITKSNHICSISTVPICDTKKYKMIKTVQDIFIKYVLSTQFLHINLCLFSDFSWSAFKSDCYMYFFSNHQDKITLELILEQIKQ